MRSYIVIGLGRFGSEAAIELTAQGCDVLAMDMRAELVQQISANVTHAVVADRKDKEVLKALGAKDFECAIVAIGDDLTASVLATMNLKELGVPCIVAKAHDEPVYSGGFHSKGHKSDSFHAFKGRMPTIRPLSGMFLI